MNRFIRDVKQYSKYTQHSAKAILKSEVANSYLNWLWWILDPICFMIIYYFIFGIVFGAKEKYFLAFIFIGLTIWDFFNKTVMQSVKIVKNNKSIVSKVYLPKYILIFVKMLVNGFKMAISFAIIIILMIIYRVPLTVNILYVVPLMLVLFVLTFGISTFLLHFGVYVEDLSNVVTIVLRLMFYITGIFYNIMTKLEAPYNLVIARGNPMAFLLTSLRQAMLYGEAPDMIILLLWLAFGLLLSVFGVRLIYKNENSYVKVI